MTSRDNLFVDVDASAVTPVEKTCALDSSAFDVALARRSSNDDDASTSAGAKARRCAAPLDAVIASACVSDDECDALIDAARRAGYTFWHADADAPNRRSFRNADTVEVELYMVVTPSTAKALALLEQARAAQVGDHRGHRVDGVMHAVPYT